MQMIANMGEKLEWLRYATIYTLLPAAICFAAGTCLCSRKK